MRIFVLNVGSSTCKSSIFEMTSSDRVELLWNEIVEFDQNGIHSLSTYVQQFLKKYPSSIDVVGHRVVHGGEVYTKPTFISKEVKKVIRKYAYLAPLHNPGNLSGIEIMQRFFPSIPHVAVFDTAFHATIPEKANCYPIPYSLRRTGIRRYGFHGISHEYCVNQASHLLHQDLFHLKIITCHLGNGSSLAAISKGVCIDTTMGFTPLEGLMMGTRCGSIDPGILLFLLKGKMTIEELDHCLNQESGLKGICGTFDLREILEKRRQGDKQASLAFDMLGHSLVKGVGSLVGSLGGVDLLIFAGGIGENCSELRRHICERWGIELNPLENDHGKGDREISVSRSKIKALVIHTREDLAIARACFHALEG